MSTLADRIRHRLIELHLSARRASLSAGLGPDAIRSIFNGTSKSPRAETLVALARVLECDVEYLIGEVESAPARTRLAGPTHPWFGGELNHDVWYAAGKREALRGSAMVQMDPRYPPSLQLVLIVGDKSGERWNFNTRSFVHVVRITRSVKLVPASNELICVRRYRSFASGAELTEQSMWQAHTAEDGLVTLSTGYGRDVNNEYFSLPEEAVDDQEPNIRLLADGTRVELFGIVIRGYIEAPGHAILGDVNEMRQDGRDWWSD